MKQSLYGIALAGLFISCTPKDQKAEHRAVTTIEYADRFSLENVEQGTLVTLKINDGYEIRYLLQRGDQDPEGTTADYTIQVPVNNVVCLSSTHIALMNSLNTLNNIQCINSRKAVYNPLIIKAIEQGRICEAGDEEEMNLEQLVSMSPDLIFQSVSGMPGARMERLQRVGLNVFPIPAHYETHPLGRLEWVKLFALFFNKEAEATAIFNAARERYNHVLQQTANAQNKPKVITGYYTKGAWVAPGGKSYFAKLLADAGADYVWKGDSTAGNLTLNFEEALQKGIEADYFINIQMVYKTREQVLQEIPEIVAFKSVKADGVYMNNAMVNENGKNNYWEQGVVEPDVVLMDLASIFHPALFPEHKLVYFKK